MHRVRSSLVATLAFTLSSTMPSAASAQVGWAHFRTHVVGSNNSFEDRGVSHTFVQGSNGLEETFTAEFTPGSHTLARIDAPIGDCRASADNVSFTITAGKWTEVDVPVTLRDCKLNIAILPVGDGNFNGVGDGVGTVNFTVFPSIGAPIPVANCTTVEGGPALYQWVDFHACHGVAPYGDRVTVTVTPGLNSLSGYKVDSAAADTLDALDGFGFAFADTTHPHPNGVSLHTDLGITLVGGSAQGFVSNSIFRIVNHGPNNAYNVRVLVDAIATENENVNGAMSIADGSCGGLSCSLSMLPAGDSTTVNVRLETIPDLQPDTPADSFPSVMVSCTTLTVSNYGAADNPGPADPNTSNNTAACITTTVPVTVALGGSTPPSHTVAAGSSDVPMIEFVLSPASLQTVTGVTVQASGTGNEQTDVTAVHLYIDKNANGAVDAGDSLVATGTFAANNGSVTLAVNPGLAITAPTALLVTYSFSVTVAERLGGAIVLAFLPLFLIPATRKRKTVLAMLLVMLTSVAVVSCGGDSTGPKTGNGSVTFQSTLTGVTTTTGSVANLAVSGATITINK